MKKITLPFRKKLKQFKKLITHLKKDSSEKTTREIKRLFAQLSFQVPSIYLKRTLVGSTLAIALLSGTNIHAQNFKAPVRNPFNIKNVEGIAQPAFFDIDHDGDYDLMYASLYGDHLLYKNTGTKFAPNFSAALTNPYGLASSGLTSTLLTTGDIDHDGDLDILECGLDYYGDTTIHFKFLENTGTATAPAFAAVVDNPFGLTAPHGYFGGPQMIDFDKDGDLDVFLNAYDYTAYTNSYLVYLNIGTTTSPSFGAPLTNPYGMHSEVGFSYPVFADIDKDGDLDIYNSDYYGKLILYKDTSGTTGDPAYSNIGIPNPHNLVFPDSGVRIGNFIDIDGDLDLDFFATSGFDYTTYETGLWFFKDTSSSVGIVNVPENNLAFTIYPQPVTNEMNVELALDLDKKSIITISDAQGKIVYNTEFVSSKNTLNLSELTTGLYTIQIENDQFKGVKKFIKK